MFKKGFSQIVIIIIIIAVLVVAGTGAGIWYWQDQKIKALEKEKEEFKRRVVNLDELKWKTYKDEERQGLIFDYPGSWILAKDEWDAETDHSKIRLIGVTKNFDSALYFLVDINAAYGLEFLNKDISSSKITIGGIPATKKILTSTFPDFSDEIYITVSFERESKNIEGKLTKDGYWIGMSFKKDQDIEAMSSLFDKVVASFKFIK